MIELINISGQQFYAFKTDELIKVSNRKDKCAIIIDENNLAEFISRSIDLIRESVSQIIIIGKNLNNVYPLLKEEKVLLISALSFEEAVTFSVLGVKLNSDVVYISNKKEVELRKLLEFLSVEL